MNSKQSISNLQKYLFQNVKLRRNIRKAGKTKKKDKIKKSIMNRSATQLINTLKTTFQMLMIRSIRIMWKKDRNFNGSMTHSQNASSLIWSLSNYFLN
jgi:hypothetical protein